jgi:hypothetical protein
VNRGDRPELAELGEDRRLAEVAGVDDQVGTAQELETAIRETALTPREVRIGDDRELQLLWSRRSERARLASIRSR